MKNVLILSGTASAINIINALENVEGIQLFVTDASKYATALYNANVIPFLVPRARNHKEYKAAIDKIIIQYNIHYLLPTSDHDMEGVMALINDGWRPNVKMFSPDFSVYDRLTHKAKLLKGLEVNGLGIPKVYSINEPIDFPVIIKPSREGGGKGIWTVKNQEELNERYEVIKRQYGDDIIIQEYIPGGAGSIYVALLLYDQNGNLCGEAASRSLLTYFSWGGGGNAGELVHEPELLNLAKRIVEESGGWKGPLNVEFKRHSESKKFYIMEVNCRLNGYSYLTTMNGMNFPQAMIDILSGSKPSFLSISNAKKRKNFIISFIEKEVPEWIA